MRYLLAWAVSVTVAMSSSIAFADDSSDCRDNNDHDVRIKTCSTVIDRDPTNVVAYHNRGVSYQFKGDLDRAITDYSIAIELNPNYAPAYDSRGRAYARKGDYTHAVADVTKASELAPKNTPRPKTNAPAPPKTDAVARMKGDEGKEAPEISQGPVGAWPPWGRPQTGRSPHNKAAQQVRGVQYP
jgi:tetratricopeptide (TPR) repeat protein